MKTLQELMRLDGRVALITGGAGHLGLAMGEALAELGCGLCLVDADTEGLEAAEARLREAWPVTVWSRHVDLEDEVVRRGLPAWVEKSAGRLDILVNNAAFVGSQGLTGWVTSFELQSLDTWRRCLEVNLTAAFELSQAFTPLLRASGQGSIVNVGSIYGVVSPDLGLYEGTRMGNPAAYAASKGGLVQLTRWLATVLAPDIRVNCLSPGGVFRQQDEAFVARYLERTPLGRMAREEDFKGAIAYLATGLSAYVTGQNLLVDGGWTTW
jgi:NAD(P)-dependent dehydrogenase (short-subunit alcohol dehydrogenase family)